MMLEIILPPVPILMGPGNMDPLETPQYLERTPFVKIQINHYRYGCDITMNFLRLAFY
jgi:hypothetical protein